MAYNLSDSGSPSYDASGHLNQCFIGGGGYLHNTAIAFPSAVAHLWDFWVKFTHSTVKVPLGNQRDVYVASDTGGHIYFQANAGPIVSTVVANDGNWHHVILAFGPAGFSLSVDGETPVTNGTAYAENTVGVPDPGIWIGTFGGDAGFAWPGRVDEVSFSQDGIEVALWHLDNNGLDSAAPPLSVSAPVITAQTTTAVTLSVSPAGGVAPYSYQWHVSSAPNFTAGGGNAIGGATSASVTISVTSSPQFARCVVTDSAAGSVMTYQRTINAARDDALTIIRIGDSTSNTPSLGASAPFCAALELRTRGGFANVVNTNKAVDGSSTSDWAAGGANMNAFDAAVAACTTPFIVSISLGVNDAQGSVAAATYGSHMAAIVSHVLAQVNASSAAPLAVFLDYPTWREPGYYNVASGTFSEAYSGYIFDYADEIDGIVNGTTVLTGNAKSLKLFAEYPSVYMALDSGSGGQVGFIHPNALGAQAMGFEIAQAIWDLLYPSSGGGDAGINGSSILGML